MSPHSAFYVLLFGELLLSILKSVTCKVMVTQVMRKTGQVLGAQIDVVTWMDALGVLLGWARVCESRFVMWESLHDGKRNEIFLIF